MHIGNIRISDLMMLRFLTGTDGRDKNVNLEI